jgi:hypothetical protein
MEQGHRGQFFGALDARGDVVSHVLMEGKVDDGGGSMSKGVIDEWTVGCGGEDCDGVATAEEEMGQVEDWDGVAFGHEWKENHTVSLCFRVGTHFSSSSFFLSFSRALFVCCCFW